MKLFAISVFILTLSAMSLFASTSTIISHNDVHRSAQLAERAIESYGHQSGTITSVPLLDARAWVIHTADGRCFDPTNLPDSLKVEGTKVNFSFKSAADWGYIYACGELVELTQVSRAK